jgi:MFS family permease
MSSERQHAESSLAQQAATTLSALQQYAIVTANYWAFTLTDGALRMLVVFHFHQLGYSTLEIAFLFLFYEFFGIVTNLYGGWLGGRFGLRLTLWSGTLLQVAALLMLIPVADSWPKWWSVAYVMVAQALSGIAKDLNKMSAKSAIKTVVPETPDDHNRGEQLFRWVAILTGSKNALKGVGFFLGGVLLTTLGFNVAVAVMAAGLFLAFCATLVLPADMGRMKSKPAFKSLFSKSQGINVLSLARFFLFGARDVWFVVALPVFLEAALGWRFWEVGGFMGLWVIGYGIVQGSAPALRRAWGKSAPPGVAAVQFWSAVLTAIPALIAIALSRQVGNPGVAVVVGLAVFGMVFAMNSSIHSYMILAYTDSESVSLNVGFYYMANAAGRLVGTLLSGGMFLVGGLQACLWTSSLLVAAAFVVSTQLPAPPRQLRPMN